MQDVAKAGGWEGHAVVMSEKAAKDFRLATRELNEAGKSGALDKFKELMSSFISLQGLGGLEPLIDFFRFFIKMIEAGGAEHAARMAKALAEMMPMMAKLGILIGKTNSGTADLVVSINDWRKSMGISEKTIDQNKDAISEWGEAIGILTSPVRTVVALIQGFGIAAERTADALEKLKKIVEALGRAGRRSGGSGGGSGGSSGIGGISLPDFSIG